MEEKKINRQRKETSSGMGSLFTAFPRERIYENPFTTG
jgi:hypothetical protein